MVFQINSLLDIINNEITDKKSFANKEAFLLELLKNIDDKDIIKELIEKSNLTKEQKADILNQVLKNSKNSTLIKTEITKNKIENLKSTNKKNTNLNIKPELLNIKSKLPDFHDYNVKNKNSKLKAALNIDNNEKLNNTEELNKLLVSITQQKEITEKIKHIIIQKSKNNPLLNKIVKTDEFKNASSFKDLIELSQKYDLNLTKITLSSEIKNTNQYTKTLYSELPDFNNTDNKTSKNTTIQFLSYLSKQSFDKQTAQENKNSEKSKLSLKNLIQQTTDNKTEELTSHTNNTPKTSIKNKSEEIKQILNTSEDLKELIHQSTQQKDIKNSKKENKDNQNNNENLQLSSSITVNNLKSKIIAAKQTIKHFSTSLKEAIENYKPPITKLSLELNPKELGRVEVTLKQRGDNLHVQINTNNQNAITFFTTQQQELKNALVNMGFTNIDMNFNSNNQKQKEQSQKKYKINQENEEELIIDMTYKYA